MPAVFLHQLRSSRSAGVGSRKSRSWRSCDDDDGDAAMQSSVDSVVGSVGEVVSADASLIEPAAVDLAVVDTMDNDLSTKVLLLVVVVVACVDNACVVRLTPAPMSLLTTTAAATSSRSNGDSSACVRGCRSSTCVCVCVCREDDCCLAFILLAMEVSKGDRLSLVFCLATVFLLLSGREFRRLFLALASLAATLPFVLTCFKIVVLGARASYAPASSFMQLFAKACAWLGASCCSVR